ncbi:MAG TPA: GNAT family N-acetyltransferase [Rubrivivax sp.]|nr:GNAT family N-acetyltransferase [Rubrivivax sp.]
MAAMHLVRPGPQHLAAYAAALQRGWSADNIRGAVAAREELDRIAHDPAAFLALMDDPDGLGPPVTLPDGTVKPRIPSLRRWMWVDGEDGGFAGTIGLRWAKDGAPLPPHVLGHIGYAVVPWQQRRGMATRALALMLPLARERGLRHVEITTDPDNLASQKVILANGGVIVETFDKGAAYGHAPGLRYRIELRP